MAKTDKPYHYCFSCGYLGTKEYPKSCNHTKFRQLDSFEFQDTPLEELEEVRFEILTDYIYSKTWMNSKVYVKKDTENSPIIVKLELTKTQAKKPRSATIKVLSDLSCCGFQLEFSDPNNFAPNNRLVPVLHEICSRATKLFYNGFNSELVSEVFNTVDTDDVKKYLPENSKLVTEHNKEDEKEVILITDNGITKLYIIKFDEELSRLKVEKIHKLI